MIRVLLFVLCLTGCAAPVRESVVLLPDPGGTIGSLTLMTPQGPRTLAARLEGLTVRGVNTVEQAQVSTVDLERQFGQVLDAEVRPPLVLVIHFDTGEALLTEKARTVLDAIQDDIRRRGVAEIQITGHTDQMGSDDDNDQLGLARAVRVWEALTEAGIVSGPLVWIRVTSRGSRQPLVDAPGRPEAVNRRVEVRVR